MQPLILHKNKVETRKLVSHQILSHQNSKSRVLRNQVFPQDFAEKKSKQNLINAGKGVTVWVNGSWECWKCHSLGQTPKRIKPKIIVCFFVYLSNLYVTHLRESRMQSVLSCSPHSKQSMSRSRYGTVFSFRISPKKSVYALFHLNLTPCGTSHKTYIGHSQIARLLEC